MFDELTSDRRDDHAVLRVHDGCALVVDFDLQERCAWRAIAEGYRQALLTLDAGHPEFTSFRRRFETAADAAGLHRTRDLSVLRPVQGVGVAG
jgi:hypothetical protein